MRGSLGYQDTNIFYDEAALKFYIQTNSSASISRWSSHTNQIYRASEPSGAFQTHKHMYTSGLRRGGAYLDLYLNF